MTPQWRVTPSSDGRGEQSEDKRPLIPRNRRWWALFGGLLVLNLVLVFATGGAASARAGALPAVLRRAAARPATSSRSARSRTRSTASSGAPCGTTRPGDAEPVDVTLFKTQVPAFIDRAELTRLSAARTWW